MQRLKETSPFEIKSNQSHKVMEPNKKKQQKKDQIIENLQEQ